MYKMIQLPWNIPADIGICMPTPIFFPVWRETPLNNINIHVVSTVSRTVLRTLEDWNFSCDLNRRCLYWWFFCTLHPFENSTMQPFIKMHAKKKCRQILKIASCHDIVFDDEKSRPSLGCLPVKFLPWW